MAIANDIVFFASMEAYLSNYSFSTSTLLAQETGAIYQKYHDGLVTPKRTSSKAVDSSRLISACYAKQEDYTRKS